MLRSIKGKILSIYIFLIFLISFIALIAIYNLYSLNKAIDGLIASNYKSIVAATNMINAIERQDSNQLIYLEVDRQKGIRAFNENQKEFFTWLSRAEDNITESGESEIIDNISRKYVSYIEYFSKLQEIENNSEETKASIFYDNDIYPIFLSVKESCIELLTINENAMFESKDKATVNSRNQMYGITIISILSIALGLSVAFYFTRKITNPIYILIAGVKSIKGGNLNQEIEIITKDEIGELASEFNNMTRRLYNYEKSNIKNLIVEKNKSLAIVKSIYDPIVVTDNDYRISLVNRSAETVFGISEKDALGRHFLEAIDNSKIFKQVKHVTEGHEYADNTNLLTINSSDKTHYYILTVTTILNDDNNISGTVSVLQDVTHLKEVERLKSDFISTVSHELRTPLTSIIMGTGLLLDSTSGELNRDQREIVEAIDQDGNQLMFLINDLLDLSRVESGKMEFVFEKASMYDIVESCIKPLSEIAVSKGVKLFHDVNKNLISISMDSKKIKSVINNLITNALKFTTSGNMIKVSAWVDGEFMKVSVRDTGSGIPEEYHESIFSKFVQVQVTGDDKGGTGLGLAIAREFVKKHGGTIWVESKPGEGSNFVFTLPLYRG